MSLDDVDDAAPWPYEQATAAADAARQEAEQTLEEADRAIRNAHLAAACAISLATAATFLSAAFIAGHIL